MTSPYDHPQPTLKARTERGDDLVLRLPTEADVDALIRTCRDPEALRWTSIPLGYDRDRALGFINDYAPGWWKRRAGGCWVVAADDDDRYLGQIDLRVKSDPAVADVGFVVDPIARGHGYMTAALRTVAEYGLRELGLRRVEWMAHVGNEASRTVARRAGFQFEGVLRGGCDDRGTRVDAWIAALVRDDLPS